MYYNLSDEQKIYLHVSYSMLEEGYNVDQILEFWSLDDEDKVKEILESVTLSEEIDTTNPDFLLICERDLLGISQFVQKLFRGMSGKVRPPKVKTPTQTAGGRPITSSSTRPSSTSRSRVTSDGARSSSDATRTSVRDRLKNLPPSVKRGGAIAAGAGGITALGKYLMDRGMIPAESDTTTTTTTTTPPKVDSNTDMEGNPTGCKGPGGCPDGRGQDPSLGQSTTGDDKDKKDTTPAADPKDTKPKSSYGWWMLHRQQPDLYKRSPGYRVSRDAYRNIRANPRPSIYDNFDLIADYLINEGHASTIEEAEYVMQQLDNDFIQSIIEEYPKKPIGYSNPSIDGNPIPNPPGHPKEGKPMSFNKAETEGYREAMQKHRKRYPNSYKK